MGRLYTRRPGEFANDPAPQQLTAPCRKYTGRLHHPIEQGVYRWISLDFGESYAVPLMPDDQDRYRDHNFGCSWRLWRLRPLRRGVRPVSDPGLTLV